MSDLKNTEIIIKGLDVPIGAAEPLFKDIPTGAYFTSEYEGAVVRKYHDSGIMNAGGFIHSRNPDQAQRNLRIAKKVTVEF